MKTLIVFSLGVLVVYVSAACPMMGDKVPRKLSRELEEYHSTLNATVHPEKRTFGFDPEAQYVSTTGDHAFVPPGPGDMRGPCPGLNAMANHNYLPHNGVATITQFTQGCLQVFGMGVDLAAFLAVYGAVFDGDLLTFSIGRPSSGLLPLPGPQGLTGSHNHYEGDVSPTRGDYFLYDGDNYDVQIDQFLDLYNMQGNISDDQVNYDIPLLTEFRVKRFQQSIDTNPNFFNGVFSGVAAQPAAYQFIYRFMANKSAEHPEGILNRQVLKSFYGISGPENDLVYNPGHERIPDSWYKRAIGDEYGIVPLLLETTGIALQHLEFLSVGGNTGTVDSFTGVDIEMLTKGVFNSETLLEGNNLGCFAFQAAVLAGPTLVGQALEIMTDALSKVVAELGCPQLEEIDRSQLQQFPGYQGPF